MAISPPAVLVDSARFFSLHTTEVSVSDFQQQNGGKFHVAHTVSESVPGGKWTKPFGPSLLINVLYTHWQRVLTFSIGGIAERLRVIKVNTKGFLKNAVFTPLQFAL